MTDDRDKREAFERLFGVPVPVITAGHDPAPTERYEVEVEDGLGRTLSIEAIVLDVTGYEEEA